MKFPQFFKLNLTDSRSSASPAILFLALFPFIYHLPSALGQTVFSFGDIFLFFYPTRLGYANALKEFRLPLWAPELMAGFPLYAEGQIGAWYPTHPFLYGLLPIHLATNYDILLHIAWVAVGTYLFSRSIGLQLPSALLAAFAFAWGGFFTPRYQHMSVLATAAWLPWLLWAWEKREQARDRSGKTRWFGVLVLMSAVQLFGGHPQFAFLSAMMVFAYALVRWRRDSDSSPPSGQDTIRRNNISAHVKSFAREYINWGAALPVVVIFALGVLIAAVQLIPTFELGNYSSRASGLLPKFFNAFSLRAIHFAMLFHPFLLGNPYPHVSVEVIGYVGLLPLVFALGAILLRRDRRVMFFLFFAAIALFLGLGDQNVFYRGLRYLPLFSYFRVPSRFFYWYTFAAAMLAACAFEYFLARAKRTPHLTRSQKVTIALFVLLGALTLGLVRSIPLEAWLAAWVWIPLLLACVTAWIVLGARHSLFSRTTLAALVLGLSILDLSFFAAVYAKTYDETIPAADFYRPPDSLSVVQDVAPEGNRVLTSLWIYPVISTMREALYPNISMIYGVPNAIGYTPLIFERAGLYLEKMSAPMLNLLNVRYYLIPQMLPTTPQVEGDDLENDYMVKFMKERAIIPPTRVAKIVLTSSLAQSAHLRDGEVVAYIFLVTQDGKTRSVALRAGLDTAEWAYERTDVRAAIQHSKPRVATIFPARSSFPPESHLGHTFLAEYDVSEGGNPITVVGVYVTPVIHPGLVRIERFDLIGADGRAVSLHHLVGRDNQSLIYRSHHVAIYENPDALPRALVVHRTRVTSDERAHATLLDDRFNPRQLLLLAKGVELDVEDGSQRFDESVRIVEYRPEQIILDVAVRSEAYVLITDSWYPGWVARVDGKETPIERANLIFRAVHVSEGNHRIEMEYRPLSLYLGAAVSLSALLGLAGIALWRRGVL